MAVWLNLAWLLIVVPFASAVIGATIFARLFIHWLDSKVRDE